MLLGVLGGMGPAATADFLAKLVKATPAQRDQHHIPTVICSIPQIPDRTDAILNGGQSPLPAMLRALTLLETCGASFVVIPCNTAHFWFDELQRETALPIVHVVDATVQTIRLRHAAAGVVGLLATTATVQAGIYADRLRSLGIECLIPEPRDQARVMDVIRAVKSAGPAQHDAHAIEEIAARLTSRGAVSIILGCSELPLAVSKPTEAYVDATEALALACVRVFQRTCWQDSLVTPAEMVCLENMPEKCKTRP